MSNKNVVIIGAGLVGALLGVSLQQRGFNVSIYERYVDIRSIPSLGRSINLVLTSRGLRSIAKISRQLAEDMLKLSVKVVGRGLHVDGQAMQFQRYGKDDSEFNNSISRFDLNVFLINAAEKAGAKIHFNSKVTGVDFDKKQVLIQTGSLESKPQMIGGGVGEKTKQTSSSGSRQKIKYDYLFGVDGGGSAVRYAMRDAGFTEFYEEFINSGYKEMIFPQYPAKGSNAVPQDPKLLHIWPRHEHFLMTLADLAGTFTGTFYLPMTGPESFETIKTEAQVRAFFTKYYPDTFELMGERGLDEMVKQYMANPVGRLGSVRCFKYNYKNEVLLLGDAAHAMVPFFGQGTNCGFEDVLEFLRLLEANGNHIAPDMFERYDATRRPNAEAIQHMALDNFHEMQSRVADPEFLLIKGIENVLETECPELYRSRYAMVCYGGLGNVSYYNAWRLGYLQEELRKKLAEGLKSPEELDLKKAKEMLRKHLLPVQKRLGIDLTTVNHEFWNQGGHTKSKL